MLGGATGVHQGQHGQQALAADELEVLIVDDSFTALHSVRNMLQRCGIEQFAEAENGRQALPMINPLPTHTAKTDQRRLAGVRRSGVSAIFDPAAQGRFTAWRAAARAGLKHAAHQPF